MKRYLSILVALMLSVGAAMAQIGYQVTVFDPATKAPKANQTVSASVTISDSAGKTICTQSISGTTDEFGILSMTVGGASTFANVDWSKLPLWISASVDGVTISKTQILTVPVAEHAKHTGSLTVDILCSQKWGNFQFHRNGTVSYDMKGSTATGSYYIDGNTVVGRIVDQYIYGGQFVGHYAPQVGRVYVVMDN